MFGIDFSEILVIFGIALVVLGPERLPKLAATIGRWIGRARAMARQFHEQLEQEASGLQQNMNLGPDFDPPRPGAAQGAVTPNIRPPASSTAPETAHGSHATVAAAQEAIAPTPAAAAAPPSAPEAAGASATADICVTDLTTPTSTVTTPSSTGTAKTEQSFEYGLAHTHLSALHPEPTTPPLSAAATPLSAAATSAHSNAAADVAATTPPEAVSAPDEPKQQTFWPV